MTAAPSAPIRYRRFTRGRIIGFVVIVLGLIVVEGSRKEPTPPASGDTFSSISGFAPAADTGPLRVATLNMAGGVGGDDNRFDLARTADAVRDYDIVGLQEVHGPELHLLGKNIPFPFGSDEANSLGKTLNIPWLFAPSETQWWRDSFGNGALTKLPVLRWQRFPLSNAGADTNRCVLLLRLQYQSKPLNVIITHLGRHQDHDAELKSVLALFQSMEKPVVLLADLNSEDNDPQLATLKSLSDQTGITLADKSGNLDWILARGMHAINSGLSDNGASDHHLEWAELEPDESK